MTLNDCVHHYAQLVAQRQMIEAIEQYYHDDIVQYEPSGEPLVGKKILLTKEKTVQDQIEIATCRVSISSINPDTGRVQGKMYFEFRSVEMGDRVLDEQFVQIWRDGKIVEQRFVY